MSKIFSSFLFKLILTVIISIFIGFQLAKIEFKEAEYKFRKILSSKPAIAIDNNLQSKVQSFLEGKPGEYSVYVKDLKTEGKRNICIKCSEAFEAASLYKVFLMAAGFQAISDGKLTLGDEISAKMSHLEEVYGGVDFGYEGFSEDEVITYTVSEILERIATISDNFASLMLAEKIGWGAVQKIANQIGEGQTLIQNPITTSTKDVGLLLEKLYKGEVVSLESSEQILDTLSRSKLNDRIPAKLPKEDPSTGSGLKIAHKTGELSRVRNDAGVVFFDENPYVIVLMSKNLKGEDEGVENLAEISKIVYDYYNTNAK